MTYEQQFLTHLALIDSVIAFIARRHGLSDADEEEFGAHVHAETVRWTKVIKDAGIKINP